MVTKLILGASILWAAGNQAWPGTVLFDFETDQEVAAWHDEGGTSLSPPKRLERVERFAASGRCSMRFTTPRWRPEEHGGARVWPAFECKPPITDWSKYDRLVMSLVNESAAPQQLMVFISDTKVPTRGGLFHRERLAPTSSAQVVVNLHQGFRGVNPSDIHVMHFFTEDPPEDMVVYIDRLLLLEPGEEVPPLPTSYLREVAGLQGQAVAGLRQSLAEANVRLRETAAQVAGIQAWLEETLGNLDAQVTELERRIQAADGSVLAIPTDVGRVQTDLDHLRGKLDLRAEFERIRPSVQSGTWRRDDVIVGFATSMEKVLPRAGAPSLKMMVRPTLALAQNEKEAFQVVVMPLSQGLRQVELRVGNMQGPEGLAFPVQNIEIAPVGYVETKAVPPYGSPHLGWWPDPILGFLGPVDIAPGDAQAFWVRVRAPKTQAPGTYQGRLQLLVEGELAFEFELAVRVYGFQLPDASPLPLAITFWPHDHPTAETQSLQEEWRKSPDYPVNAWRRHKSEWVDFLADYYITYDSLYQYEGWAPDFEELARLRDTGRLGMFNLGYFSGLAEGEEARAAWYADIRERLRPRYERAKELGLLNHAYIYGADENPAEMFPLVERAAAALKAEFPEVPVMTTTYDHSYGLETEMRSVDAWCPLTPSFDPRRAQEARAQGRKVWWYICCGPHHPYANMFVEYPAIEGRLLMGAMTAKQRPDGFLYYQISIWNSERPIESGPFTNWDPRSWTSYHGDGSWTCVGPDGTPLPTIRLENFRDGLEDYAYYLVLEAMVTQVEGSPELREGREEWLQQARAALEVPQEVVASMTEYTRDPAVLYKYRTALAEAIESAPIAPVYPW